MNTIIPIMIPISPSSSDNCPKCKNEENIIQVCKHCGYVYPEDGGSWLDWLFCLLIVIFIIIIINYIGVLGYWIFQDKSTQYGFGPETLEKVIRNNFHFYFGWVDGLNNLKIK